jgi:hypothetical protein
MLRHPARATLLIAIGIMLSYSIGCILSPEEEVRPNDNPTIVYKDLTQPENLIENLVSSYKDKNIARYEELLLTTGDGGYNREYYFHYQEGDVGVIGEENDDREADVDMTRNIFRAANGDPNLDKGHVAIDKLELTIYGGTWDTLDTLWNEYHPGVKYTKRQYYVSILVNGNTIYGDDYVEFYLVPVVEGEVTTYRIASAFDVLN